MCGPGNAQQAGDRAARQPHPAGKRILERTRRTESHDYLSGQPRAHVSGRRLHRMGTDAGNPGTAHGPSVYREMELMQRAGMPAAAVFASATIGAAKAMGRGAEVGSV